MIAGLTTLIAVLGVALTLVLIGRIRAAEATIKLRKHRSTAEGLADLLTYAAVIKDGVIVCKSGALMSAWLYRGADDASSTDQERVLVAARINQALARLGSGWMVHIDGVRRPSPSYPAEHESAFPDDVSKALDEERRRHFEGLHQMYEGYFVVSLTWLPPSMAQRRFVEMMFSDDELPPDATKRTNDLLEHFITEAKTVESRLSAAVSLTRLQSHQVTEENGSQVTYDDLLAWLQYCISGVHQRVRLPDNPIYLDALIGGQEMWGGVVPRIGRKYIQVVAIEGFPLEATPGILASLNEMECEYRFSSRFIFLDRHEAVAYLDKFRKKWKQKIRGIFDQMFNTNTGSVNQDAVDMVHQAEAARADVESGTVAGGFLSSNIVLMGEDRKALANTALQVEKAVNRLGFTARVESLNTIEAFLGTLPGHGVENVRRPYVNTANIATLIPTSTVWTGQATAPCPFYPPDSPALMQCVTSGSTPFRLNLHVDDLGHTLMFGPPGSGKSVHLAMLAAQFRRYAGMTVFAFDKGNSLYPLTTAIHSATNGKSGLHYDIGTDGSRLHFAPLAELSTRSHRAWAMEWIDMLLGLNGLQTTPAQRRIIAEAILSMSESGGTTLSEFSVTVQDVAIREVINQYTVDGPYGELLDSKVDGLTLSDFTTFEIETLMEMGARITLPVMFYLFRCIQLALKGQPAVIFIDEAWLMLSHPVFAAKIKEWLKVLRKANCIVVLATQNLSDAANSGILDVMVEATATKIFLPNPFAIDEEQSKTYQRMGLNPRQIQIIASAQRKRHYYYVSEKGRRLYELALGPLALALTVSDKDSITAIKSLQTLHGSDWLKPWLKSRSVNSDIYRDAA